MLKPVFFFSKDIFLKRELQEWQCKDVILWGYGQATLITRLQLPRSRNKKGNSVQVSVPQSLCSHAPQRGRGRVREAVEVTQNE